MCDPSSAPTTTNIGAGARCTSQPSCRLSESLELSSPVGVPDRPSPLWVCRWRGDCLEPGRYHRSKRLGRRLESRTSSQLRGRKSTSALVVELDGWKSRAMKHKTAQLLVGVAGVALIVLYSVLMMATEGSSGWSWVLLVAGIALLVGGGRMLRRGTAT